MLLINCFWANGFKVIECISQVQENKWIPKSYPAETLRAEWQTQSVRGHWSICPWCTHPALMLHLSERVCPQSRKDYNHHVIIIRLIYCSGFFVSQPCMSLRLRRREHQFHVIAVLFCKYVICIHIIGLTMCTIDDRWYILISVTWSLYVSSDGRLHVWLLHGESLLCMYYSVVSA